MCLLGLGTAQTRTFPYPSIKVMCVYMTDIEMVFCASDCL